MKITEEMKRANEEYKKEVYSNKDFFINRTLHFMASSSDLIYAKLSQIHNNSYGELNEETKESIEEIYGTLFFLKTSAEEAQSKKEQIDYYIKEKTGFSFHE